MTRTFPPGFLWGVTTGAHQIEGNNVASDWWSSEHAPGARMEEPSGDAADSYHRWREDMDLAAGAGFTDYRFGIEWSRVEPADGRISHAGVAHYRRMVEGAVERGLRPLPTLHHFTHPLWFTLSGGWSRPDAVERFLRYVDALAPVLGAGVERVETINEPNIFASLKVLRASGSGDIAQGLPVPDAATTNAMIAVHHATRARLKERHPRLLVGWGVSVQDYQAEPGAEDIMAGYMYPRDEIFLEAARDDDWGGVQTYTRGCITVADGQPVPVHHPGTPLTQTGWEDYPAASADHHAWAAAPWTRRFHLSLRGGAPYHPDAAGMAAVADLVLETLASGPGPPARLGRLVVFGGDPGQGDAGADAQLVEGVAEVPVDGVGGNVEPFGDLAVGQALGDQPDHGQLGFGQGRPPQGGPALSGQAAADPELPEAPPDPGEIPAGPAGGVAGQGPVEGGDGLITVDGPDLGHGEIFLGGGEGEPSLAGFEEGDGLGQQAGVHGEQAPGVDGAGLAGGYPGVELGSPLGAGCRRLGKFVVSAR
jgi:beta-glucosidase